MNRARTIGYWSTTAVLAAVLGSGGVADVLHVPATTTGVLALGYPSYFVTILGIWKLLGTIAILAPRFPRLKEWAYAGAYFNFSGAVISHLVSGSAIGHVLVVGIMSIITMASWALRPQSRVLGAVRPPSVVGLSIRARQGRSQLATAES